MDLNQQDIVEKERERKHVRLFVLTFHISHRSSIADCYVSGKLQWAHIRFSSGIGVGCGGATCNKYGSM